MKRSRKIALWAVMVLALIGAGVAWAALDMGIYRVNSESMRPTLPPGSVILTYKTDDLDRRDIVAYRKPEGGLVAHTFIGYATDGSLMTRGDANTVADDHRPPLTQERLVGTVFLAFTPMKGIGAVVLTLMVVFIMAIPVKEDQGSSATKPASTPA